MRPSARFLRPDPESLRRGPFGRPQQVRRRRGSRPPLAKVLLAAGVLLGTAALAQAGWGFVRSDRAFALRRLQVVGLTRNDPAPVRAALERLSGENLVALGTADVGACLHAFGWVEGFQCRKNLPDTLIVEIRERGSLCAVQTSQGVFSVDGAGHAWRAGDGERALFALAPGADPADPGLQAVVSELLTAGLGREVASLGRAASGGYLLETKDRWRLTVSPGDLAGQWAKYGRARAWASANLPGRTAVDLRWSGRAVFAPPPAVEGGESDG